MLRVNDSVVELRVRLAMGIDDVFNRGRRQIRTEKRGWGRIGKQLVKDYRARLGTCLHPVYMTTMEGEHNTPVGEAIVLAWSWLDMS